MVKQILQFIFLILPLIGMGQIHCEHEEIFVLRLDLMPYSQNFATIQIKCDASVMNLDFKTYEYDGKEILNKSYELPNKLYYDFKKEILSLDVLSMVDKPNPYMIHGMRAEITYIDRIDNFNKFVMVIPMQRNRNLDLIEEIIMLTHTLDLHKDHREYLDAINDWYLKLCEKK